MCDLLANGLLIVLSLFPTLTCTNLEPFRAQGVPPVVLVMRVYDQEGELAAEWVKQGYNYSFDGFGRIDWLVEPELLVFKRQHYYYHINYLLAGDPVSGRLYQIAEARVGRWVLAAQTQPDWSYVIYTISADGSDQVEAQRLVPYEELPLRRDQPDTRSPDGQWILRYGRWTDRFHVFGIGIFRVLHGDDYRRVFDADIVEGPWWSPDSKRFAYIVDSGDLYVSDLEGNQRRMVHGPVAFLGWRGDRLAWLAYSPFHH